MVRVQAHTIETFIISSYTKFVLNFTISPHKLLLSVADTYTLSQIFKHQHFYGLNYFVDEKSANFC